MTAKQDEDGFDLFVVLWNLSQGQTTPALHVRMARWLCACWRGGDRRLLLMAFRSSGKSTIVGLFCAWLLVRDPNLRILVLAADLALARKMVRNVKRILERHPLANGLKPAKPDQWGADRFTVNRALELRDPSMLARGVSANITGSRADVVICDDVEVPRTCDTAEKRKELRAHLAEMEFVLVPGGLQLYVGTPHTRDSLYRVDALDGRAPFLDGFARLEVPVLNAEGGSEWPERFDEAEIERLRRTSGPNRFASQMMLRPVDVSDLRLDPGRLKRYAAEFDYREAGGRAVLELQGVRMVSASCWWDPAFGRGGDGSVVAIVFSDASGQYWLHRMQYLTASGAETDEATEQCQAVAAFAARWLAPAVTVETNGIGRFLPGLLRKVLSEAKIGCGVIEAHSTRPKVQRIAEAFDAILAAGALYAHASVFESPLIDEMRDWRPSNANARDDGLDAVAGALLSEPVRIGSGLLRGKPLPDWRGGGHTARTRFRV